jgi:large subunit ribosomal protein L30
VTAVRITQTRSTIGQTRRHEGALRALGLGRIGKTAVHERSPALEGQLRLVAHLVSVAEDDGKDA